ncbi:MAG: CdaR family protein [Acidobacteriota bacterium]
MALFPLRHVGLKLLSIGVAILLWLVVTGDAEVERTMRVGLELQRAPAGIELVGAVPDTVAVRVRGAASRLSALAPGNLSVVVDLDGVRPGRRLFPLTADQVTVPYGVQVAQVTPTALPLTFEATVSRVVPVRPRIEGTPVPGHSVTNVSVNPSQVRIEGPEGAVNVLTELVTEPVSVERATSLVREAVTIDASDTGVRLSGGGSAVVTVTVAADTTERTVPGVPIAQHGSAPKGLLLQPALASVTVQGAGDVVDGLTAADIALFVEVGDARQGRELTVQAESSPRYVVRSIAPPSVRLAAAARRRR